MVTLRSSFDTVNQLSKRQIECVKKIPQPLQLKGSSHKIQKVLDLVPNRSQKVTLNVCASVLCNFISPTILTKLDLPEIFVSRFQPFK